VNTFGAFEEEAAYVDEERKRVTGIPTVRG
jgi:hypothetical protein